MFCLLLFFLIAGCAQKDDTSLIKHVVSSGEMLSSSLVANGLNQNSAAALVSELSKVFNPKLSREGDYYELELSTDGKFKKFSYYPRGAIFYEVIVDEKGKIVSSKKELPETTIRRQIKGTLKSSLWEAMTEQNIEPEVIIRFAEIFSSQIDFLTEPRKGDMYRLIWEEKEIKTKNFKKKIIGKFLGAQYIKADSSLQAADSAARSYTAIGFEKDGLDYDYYSPDGKSLRLAFLKAPLSFRRISSFFSKKRYHPILRIYRPHHGIDYVAPSGTPVSSIGAGTVSFAGWSDGYGKVVKVKHPNGYESIYGHLSKFAKIKKGTKITQGQVIGYVGSTGVSTGPHLHFEIRLAGKPLNFFKLKLPSTKKIPQESLAEFNKIKDQVIEELEKI